MLLIATAQIFLRNSISYTIPLIFISPFLHKGKTKVCHGAEWRMTCNFQFYLLHIIRLNVAYFLLTFCEFYGDDIFISRKERCIIYIRYSHCFVSVLFDVSSQASKNIYWYLRLAKKYILNICYPLVDYLSRNIHLSLIYTTGSTVYYRKSVLHLLKRTWHMRLSRYSTDLR